MATYTVGPIPNSKRWAVNKNGYQVSKHNSKSNAKQRARKEAGPNDSITVQGRDGQFQKRLRG